MELKAHTIKNISFITHDTFLLQIDLSAKDFRYKPGDYCYIQNKSSTLPDEQRPFSIASSPTEKTHIEFCIKIYGDWTRQLSRLQPGQTLYLSDSQSDAHLVDEDYIVFLVGGVGIAPVMSMIRYLVDTHSTKQIVLLYGNKTERDIIYKEKLHNVSRVNPNIRVIHVLSEEADFSDWKGERGLLSVSLIRDAVNVHNNPIFYIYGNPMFVNLARSIVSHMHLSDNVVTRRK